MFRETQTEFFKALFRKNRIVYLMQYIYYNFFFNFGIMILWDFILIRYLIWGLINFYYIYICHSKIYIFFIFDPVFSLIF